MKGAVKMGSDFLNPKYLYTLFLVCTVIVAIVGAAAIFENWGSIVAFFRRLHKRFRRIPHIKRVPVRRSVAYDLRNVAFPAAAAGPVKK